MDIIIENADVEIKTDSGNDNGEKRSFNRPIEDENDIFAYINHLISEAEKRGDEFLILTAEKIHRELNLRGGYPEVCSAMRMAIRRGDIILRECTPGDYSTLEIKYVLRTVKKTTSPAHKNPLDIIDEIANKALNYADATFTIIRYMFVLLVGMVLMVVGVNLPAQIPITVWGGRETAFMILLIVGGILFVAAEVSTFVYLATLPVSTGAWFRSYANKARYAFSISMIGIIVSAVCLGCIDGGDVICASLLVAFITLALTFIAQAAVCGARVKR